LGVHPLIVMVSSETCVVIVYCREAIASV